MEAVLNGVIREVLDGRARLPFGGSAPRECLDEEAALFVAQTLKVAAPGACLPPLEPADSGANRNPRPHRFPGFLALSRFHE